VKVFVKVFVKVCVQVFVFEFHEHVQVRGISRGLWIVSGSK